ncbi:hypothetical protein QVD17_32010 [Tagetes erecta]|uniref:Cytochrome P450 n=1 Tax=Tagetes erecta TaxID=13708 RepID=A0AAD8NPS3_TARER|nr:hypothetical protein QVD17_32010 [Tagetes erecta]
MLKISTSLPMDILHRIFPRVQPHIDSWFKIYGENFLFLYGSQAELVVTEPELLKKIMSVKEISVKRPGGGPIYKKLVGDGLIMSHGDKWAKQRKVAIHAFTGERMIFKDKDDVESDKLEASMHYLIMQMIRRRETTILLGNEDDSTPDYLGLLLKAHHNNTDDDYKLSIQDMGMIINETLRLYPSAVFTSRKVLKETRVGKLVLPRNLNVQIPISALHQDPEIWGEDVHLFKPERFSQGIAKAVNNNPGAYIPFGYGPRTCVGANFAITEAKITLSMILQCYRFALSPNYVHEPVQHVALCPKSGVQIMLQDL